MLVSEDLGSRSYVILAQFDNGTANTSKGGTRAISHTKFCVDLPHMSVNRVLRNREYVCDHRVALSLGNPFEDLGLALSKGRSRSLFALNFAEFEMASLCDTLDAKEVNRIQLHKLFPKTQSDICVLQTRPEHIERDTITNIGICQKGQIPLSVRGRGGQLFNLMPKKRS